MTNRDGDYLGTYSCLHPGGGGGGAKSRGCGKDKDDEHEVEVKAYIIVCRSGILPIEEFKGGGDNGCV